MLKVGKKRLCVVDLDFTLVNLNTTFDFLNLFFHRKYIVFSRLLFPLLLLNKVFGSDVFKQLLLLSILWFEKRAKEELKELSKTYFKYLVSRRSINQSLLNFLKKLDCKKILLTASIDVIAEPFKELGFDIVIGSRIYYYNNIPVKILDLFGRKHKVISNLNKYFDEILVFDDSPEPQYKIIRGVKVIRVDFNEWSKSQRRNR